MFYVLHQLSSSSIIPSIDHYLLCGSLVISAFQTISWRNRLPKPLLHLLVSPEHSFHPVYAHFPGNWFLGNGNAAANLLEPSYILSSSQSTKEITLCRLRIAHSSFTHSYLLFSLFPPE